MNIIYDSECGFCKWILQKYIDYTDYPFPEFTPFGELTPNQQNMLPDTYESCFHIITHTQSVY